MSGPFNLAFGRNLASFALRELLPWAERIEVAGSIRRSRAMVGDVDLVILPTDQAAILARVKQRCRVVSGDHPCAQNTIALLPDGTQLDLFFARPKTGDLFSVIPSNFGSLLLCRTGSKEHNIAICQRAIRMGMSYDPYRGILRGGEIIAAETEEEIYTALHLPFLNPETERDEPLSAFSAPLR